VLLIYSRDGATPGVADRGTQLPSLKEGRERRGEVGEE
jgi:hypothetical protein